MKRDIMLVEDDAVSYECVRKALGTEYKVHWFKTIEEGIRGLDSLKKIDLIILDRVLPDGDGLKFLSEIKSRLSDLFPVVVLSSKSDETDQVSGFYAGAVDYIAKPFRPLEFKARVESRLRSDSKELHVGNVRLDLASFRAYRSEFGVWKEISLTHTEMKILACFMQAVDAVLPRELLLDKIWGDNFKITDRTIDTHISHLRKKLVGTNVQISSVTKEGYRLEVSAEKSQAG